MNIDDIKRKVESEEYHFLREKPLGNNIIILGLYFMNLYVVSNINRYKVLDEKLLNSIITAASTYNQVKLAEIYKTDIDLSRLVDQYNTLVRKTKTYSPNDGLKARVVAVDESYRHIYDTFNKRHFNVFIKVFMASFNEYEHRINEVIEDYIKSFI